MQQTFLPSREIEKKMKVNQTINILSLKLERGFESSRRRMKMAIIVEDQRRRTVWTKYHGDPSLFLFNRIFFIALLRGRWFVFPTPSPSPLLLPFQYSRTLAEMRKKSRSNQVSCSAPQLQTNLLLHFVILHGQD